MPPAAASPPLKRSFPRRELRVTRTATTTTTMSREKIIAKRARMTKSFMRVARQNPPLPKPCREIFAFWRQRQTGLTQRCRGRGESQRSIWAGRHTVWRKGFRSLCASLRPLRLCVSPLVSFSQSLLTSSPTLRIPTSSTFNPTRGTGSRFSPDNFRSADSGPDRSTPRRDGSNPRGRPDQISASRSGARANRSRPPGESPDAWI